MTSRFHLGAPRMARRPVAALLVAAALLAGCGTDDAADPLFPSGPTGRVRFVNLITDTTRARVNLILAGTPWNGNQVNGQVTPFTLGTVAAPQLYSPILTGTRTLVLQRTRDTTVTVATVNFDVVAEADYTIYATGGAGGSAVTSFITRDTNTVPTAAQSRVRVVHLAPAAGNVDVFVTAPTADITAPTVTPTLANVPLRGAAYLTVAPATVRVRVVPAGTAPAARTGAAILLDANNVVLPAAGNRTIVAADAVTGGTPLRALVLTDR